MQYYTCEKTREVKRNDVFFISEYLKCISPNKQMQNCSVIIVTGYKLDDWDYTPGQDSYISLHHHIQTGSEAHHLS
jgi:hypothetical protein